MSDLKALIQLQEHDSRLARLEAEASRLPKRIEAIRVSTACRSISSWSCESTLAPSGESPGWWAHPGSNQDLTGYEPAALPLSYGPSTPSRRPERPS